uniref:Uncharacterized protein n=1 Tax=Setaria viridis TaxID=4556 RepID=A0A4U6UNY3_SETVI|nr:hypothetical protein SEVIR_5G276766v2 [Setaria viridis]
MKPPFPEKYIGNCVGPAFGMAPRGELAAAGVGGLFTACAAVASAIDEAVRDIGTSSMDAWMDRVRESVAALSVAGSPRFHVYELDFGFGRPVKVDIVSVARTGAVAVGESRSSTGGMEFGVSLQPAGMERYRKCFADAIAWLHEPLRETLNSPSVFFLPSVFFRTLGKQALCRVPSQKHSAKKNTRQIGALPSVK